MTSALSRLLLLIVVIDNIMLAALGFLANNIHLAPSSFRNLGLLIKWRHFSNWDDFMANVDDLLTDQTQTSSTNVTQNPTGPYWCTIDPLSLASSFSGMMPSPVHVMIIEGRRVFLKRDDLLRLEGSHISGNKARKMLSLNQLPAAEFPSCIVSNGGPQSNSMLSLAAVVNFKNRQILGTYIREEDMSEKPIRFVYYTKKLPKFLKKQPSGNFFRALLLGMEIIELSNEEYQTLFGGDSGGSSMPPIGVDPPGRGASLWVPQGGAFKLAMQGAKVLAEEILSFWSKEGDNKPLSLILPGGTCTTAALVHHALGTLQSELAEEDRLDIKVIVVPCVGDSGYAQRQMIALNTNIGALPHDIPFILPPSPRTLVASDREAQSVKYFPFGEPNKAILDVFNLLQNKYDLQVDLVYGAPAWAIMLRHWRVSPDVSFPTSFDPNNPIAGREIMYVHSGGLEGINTQLLRYKYEGLVETKDIQPP